MTESLPKIVQKANSVALGKSKKTFVFGEEVITYINEDKSGEETIPIPYEAISFENPQIIYLKNSNGQFTTISMVMLFLGVLYYRGKGTETPQSELGFLILFGIIAIIVSLMMRGGVRYTIFNSSYGQVQVLHDKKHDNIIEQLKAHWTAVLRKKYAQLDPMNAPEKEAEKFGWLKEKGVISEQEYQDALQKIQSASTPISMAFKPSLN